jgi:hypothetical protein
MHGILQMSRVMIPRRYILAKPCLYSLEVFGRGGAYTQGGSQAPPVPCSRAAPPIIIRDRLGIDIEQFRHVIHGNGGNVFD